MIIGLLDYWIGLLDWIIGDIMNLFKRYLDDLDFYKRFQSQVRVTYLSDEGSPMLQYEYSGADRDIRAYVRGLIEAGASANIDFNIAMDALFHGMKLIRLSKLELELLEEVDLNIPVNEYVQPFPTMYVELPPDYTRGRVVPNPEYGDPSVPCPNDVTENPTHRPIMTALRVMPAYTVDLETGAKGTQNGQTVMFATYFDSTQVYTTFMREHERDIEYTMSKLFDGDPDYRFEKSLRVDEAESALAHRLMRATLNAGLLMDEYGIVKIGSVNFDRVLYLRDLIGRLRDKRKRLAKRPQSQPMVDDIDSKINRYSIEVNAIPVEYRLATKPVLYTVSRQGEGRGSVRPHRRRGHYRMQRYGPGLSLVKRIRIPPCFVNEHLVWEKEQS